MDHRARKKELLILIGWNLKRLRIKRALSQETVALEAELDTAYVSRMERGLENPTIDALDRLAIALGAKLGDFVQPKMPGVKAPANMKPGRKIDPTSKRQRALAARRR